MSATTKTEASLADRLSFAPFVALGALLLLAVVRPRAVIEVSVADFVVVTFILGGLAAWMSGRAIALTWRPYWHVVLYMAIFAIVVRWIHWALFGGTLLSLPFYLVDLVVVLSFATLGYRAFRTRQMTTQYRWLFARVNAFGWRRSNSAL
jgi:hypothetical protein